jgi:hypothetical protein
MYWNYRSICSEMGAQQMLKPMLKLDWRTQKFHQSSEDQISTAEDKLFLPVNWKS